jgi:hypothetical protein
VSRLLLIAVFLEVGVLLVIVPWTNYWDRNYFCDRFPYVQAIASNAFVRGAVSGLGVVNLLAGLGELVSLVLANRTDDPQALTPSPSARED